METRKGMKMIDPKKYEGHTPGPWEYTTSAIGKYPCGIFGYEDGVVEDCNELCNHASLTPDWPRAEQEANARLIADAPALLAEVVRLRGAIEKTLAENAHLADGDECTLKRLKEAVE